MSRNASVVSQFKVARRKAATCFCDCCGWAPPAVLDLVRVSGPWTMLHAHHVVPVGIGGADVIGNLALLCPNCHALAQAMAPHYAKLSRGQLTPAQMMRSLKLLVSDTEAWREVILAEKKTILDMRNDPDIEMTMRFARSRAETDSAIRRLMVTKSATTKRKL